MKRLFELALESEGTTIINTPENLDSVVYSEIPQEMPDGIYNGILSGHCLSFTFQEMDYNYKKKIGVRGRNIPTTFEIKDHQLVE